MITKKSINTNQKFIEIEYYSTNPDGELIKDKLESGGSIFRTGKVNININYISEIGMVNKQTFSVRSWTKNVSYNDVTCFYVRFNSGKEYWLPEREYNKFDFIIKKRT